MKEMGEMVRLLGRFSWCQQEGIGDVREVSSGSWVGCFCIHDCEVSVATMTVVREGRRVGN